MDFVLFRRHDFFFLSKDQIEFRVDEKKRDRV